MVKFRALRFVTPFKLHIARYLIWRNNQPTSQRQFRLVN